jgi:aminobenzoyl-glutamate utilization protein B
MTIANKIDGFISKSSWIRKMFEQGAMLKAQHGADNVFDFSLGNPNLPPPENFNRVLQETVAELGPGDHGYMPNIGYPAVRTSIAEFLSKVHNVALTEKELIMTVGAAYGRYFNKPVAEATYANIQSVGLPQWDEKDLTLARGLQRELGVEERGLSTEIPELTGPVDLSRSLGGGSDDIGDISWNMPTVTLRYPSNIPGGPGHNWANGIAMATPIAHKGGVAGAQVQAMTLLDLFLDGETVPAAWDFFNDVQTAESEYIPFIAETDQPAIWLNAEIMERWRPRMREFYYDPARYSTYLEQLGIEYPTVKAQPITEDGAAAGTAAPTRGPAAAGPGGGS